MPTSVPGSRRGLSRAARHGFTLIELLIVLAIIALSVGVVSMALRGGSAWTLEEEAARLSALLEMARADARAAGATVRWVPGGEGLGDGVQFRFVGLPAAQTLPTRWLDPGTRAEVVGGATVLLGPEAILPAQRIVLRLADQRLDLSSDGLRPFAVTAASSDAAVAPK